MVLLVETGKGSNREEGRGGRCLRRWIKTGGALQPTPPPPFSAEGSLVVVVVVVVVTTKKHV
jgi:hypothetical protein